MPNAKNFGGQQIIEPGVYSQVLGLVPSPAIVGTFGNLVMIDTGSQGLGIGGGGIAYGGGSGITGDLQSNGNSIYKFTDPVSFKKFVRGGLLFDLIDYLMTPSLKERGPATIYHARAATTTAPFFVFTFPISAGAVKIQCNNEGLGSNGVLTSSVLTRGYGCKIKAGIQDTTAYLIEFYEGTFRGLDANGIPYDGIYENTITTNNMVCRSIEFKTAAQLIAWMQTDLVFNTYFTLSTSGTTTSAVVIDSTVLSTYPNINLFASGTTSYSLSALQSILDNITDLDNSAFFCDDYGVTGSPSGGDITGGCNKGALSTFNQAIVAHVHTQATYTQKGVYMGGGQNSSQYNLSGTTADGSRDVAIFYNDSLVQITHSAVKVPATVSGLGLNYKYVSSLYGAALACGRMMGLEPQDPGTYKDVRIIGLKHEFKRSEREDALLHGVMHFKNVQGLGWVINQSINTMQRNASILYNDGTSPEISIMRIIHQLNKEIKLGAQTQFIGGNLITASAEDIKNYVDSYLLNRTSDTNDGNGDNLLIASEHKTTVTYSNGAWNVTYCFVPNGPVNQVFVTGFALDPNISLS